MYMLPPESSQVQGAPGHGQGDPGYGRFISQEHIAHISFILIFSVHIRYIQLYESRLFVFPLPSISRSTLLHVLFSLAPRAVPRARPRAGRYLC